MSSCISPWSSLGVRISLVTIEKCDSLNMMSCGWSNRWLAGLDSARIIIEPDFPMLL